MSYQAEIQKVQAPAWVELYEFTIGEKTNYYTSNDEDIEHNFMAWKARPIERSNFDNQEELRPDRLKIKVPLDEVMLSFVANAPVEPVLVSIKRLIIDTGDEFAIFDGEALDVSLSGNMAEVTCEAGTEIFKNEFPAFVYQARCQWMLFDEGCALNDLDFQVTATVTLSQNGAVLSSSSFGNFANGHFTLGHVRFQKDLRLITNHVGNDITLQAPFDSRLVDGGSVRAFPGCDKSRSTCVNKFNNFVNFTGFSNIPSRNPVIWGLE